MAKTIKEVLAAYGEAYYYAKTAHRLVTDRSGTEKLMESDLNKALAEISRLIDEAKPDDMYDTPFTEYPNGFNDAIDQFSANLGKIKG